MTHLAAGAAPPAYSVSYKRVVLAILVSAYTLNFIDRTIIATIGQAIKVDLKITDAQLGLLGGLYFALLYTVLGIPIARLAERFSRTNIIALAILVWSGFTALCGTAGNFLTLSAFRFGVGVGEAGLSPAAHSLISDYFPPGKRASALAVYSFGIPLGTMLGAVTGGYLAQTFSWRVAFMVVGLPGVLIAIAVKLILREPPRGHADKLAGPPRLVEDVVPDEPPVPAPTLASELKEIGAVAATLFGQWPVLNMVAGVSLVSFSSYGAIQFGAPYFIRAFGLSLAQAGALMGLVGAFGQGIGTVAGGYITDRLARRGAHWYALVPAIGVSLALPFAAAVYTAASWQTAALFLIGPGLFAYVYLGPTFGVVQNMVPTHRRATATAVLFFVLNLIGLGGGPPLTGWAIDHYAAFHFAHPDQGGIWAAIAGFFEPGLTPFKTVCPGGMAPTGAPAETAQACKAALVLATRQGVLCAYAVALWGALHYFAAAPSLGKAMARARAARGEKDQ